MKGKIPNKKSIIGTVVSDKMDKTVTISWETRKRHPLYKKFVKSHRKIKAHDEKNQASMGDLVKIQQTRPVSKEKSFRIIEILEKGQKE
ncbi:MAG: 30S ribosomal protein S17 [Candidatus Omnitrophica bacterium]|nr:30S ribosomal protein S17 [Candidatus Omnitrophota bacterium]